MRRWIPLLLIAATVLFSMVVYSRLPDPMVIHWNASGEPDGYGSRAFGTFLLPVVILFEAIRKAGSADRKKIQEALEHLSVLTPNGKYTYSPTDHAGITREYISVNVVKDGKFVPTDWAKEQLARTVASQ